MEDSFRSCFRAYQGKKANSVDADVKTKWLQNQLELVAKRWGGEVAGDRQFLLDGEMVEREWSVWSRCGWEREC